jgi:hypothetical protein
VSNPWREPGTFLSSLFSPIGKFGEAEGVLNNRSNIIAMVDEAHRTQEGDLGRKMREALPNAFLFGLTGTPIQNRLGEMWSLFDFLMPASSDGRRLSKNGGKNRLPACRPVPRRRAVEERAGDIGSGVELIVSKHGAIGDVGGGGPPHRRSSQGHGTNQEPVVSWEY